jgi:hypothetical protein
MVLTQIAATLLVAAFAALIIASIYITPYRDKWYLLSSLGYVLYASVLATLIGLIWGI